MNRFVWNLRYPNPKVLPFSYFGGMLTYVEYTLADHAIPGQTPRDQPEGMLVLPGRYTVELSSGGKTYRETLTVKADPRIRATPADLGEQSELVRQITDGLSATYDGYSQLADLRSAVADRMKSLEANTSAKEAAAAAKTLDDQVAAVQNGTPAAPGLGLINRDLARLFTMAESGDSRPSETLRSVANQQCEALAKALAGWQQLNSQGIPSLNALLAGQKLAPIPLAANIPVAPACGR